MRQQLERLQVWIYLLATGTGLASGAVAPGVAPVLEALVWPALGVLLYATFTQIPLLRLPRAFGDGRFVAALLLGNFLLLPALVGGLLPLVPDDPALRLGVMLVLLVPCTDWFISFTYLGRGDATRAVAATPLLLLVQLLMLPLYLWLFLGEAVAEMAVVEHLLTAFAGLIVLPLILAWLTELAVVGRPRRQALVLRLGWLPVPLLAAVVFLIAGSQVNTVLGMVHLLGRVLLVFVLFLAVAAVLGKALGRLFRLQPAAARTLVFSFGTRNSFVVLPLALTVSAGWEAAVVVVVFQSLVELFGMVAYLAWVPGKLIPD